MVTPQLPALQLPRAFVEHLVAQLRSAALTPGGETLLQDAQALEEVLQAASALEVVAAPPSTGDIPGAPGPWQAVLVAEACAEQLSRAGDLVGAAGARRVAQQLRALSPKRPAPGAA
jgi:hypothetical protein